MTRPGLRAGGCASPQQAAPLQPSLRSQRAGLLPSRAAIALLLSSTHDIGSPHSAAPALPLTLRLVHVHKRQFVTNDGAFLLARAEPVAHSSDSGARRELRGELLCDLSSHSCTRRDLATMAFDTEPVRFSFFNRGHRADVILANVLVDNVRHHKHRGVVGVSLPNAPASGNGEQTL